MNSSPGPFNQPVALSGAKFGMGAFGSANAGHSAATAQANAAGAPHPRIRQRGRSPAASFDIGASLKVSCREFIAKQRRLAKPRASEPQPVKTIRAALIL